jgi:hypothetical protein
LLLSKSWLCSSNQRATRFGSSEAAILQFLGCGFSLFPAR